MLDPLIAGMIHAGILQFGQFKIAGKLVPFRFSAEYLPAYPQLLGEIAERTSERLSSFKIDRLVGLEDSLAFGVACAIHTGISLAYTRSGGAFPVQNLVGAYDSGHRAALLLNELNTTLPLTAFAIDAHKVGLEITAVVPILAVQEHENAGIPIYPLFRLEDVLTELSVAEELSPHQVQVVRAWIAEPNLH